MMNRDYRSITVATFKGLLITYLTLLILDYSDPGFVSFYLNLDYLLYVVIAFGAASFLSHTQEIEKSKLDRLNRHVTVSFLVLLPLSILPLFILNGISYFAFLEAYQTHLMITVIALGIISFWLNKDKINLEEELEEERKEEEKRREEFEEKFQKVNRIPIFRSIVKWMHKEEWWCSAGLILIVTIGAFFRFFSLGKVSYNQDEGLYVLLSEGIAQNLLPILPSGLVYIRSFLFTYSVYFSTFLFGISEISVRLPSAIVGLLLIILVYFFGRDLFDKRVGILSSFLVAVDLFMIAFSREGRFYMQFVFFFVLTIYLFFRVYEKRDNLKLPLALSFVCLLLTHDLSIFIIPFFGLYFIFYKREYLKNKSTYFVFIPPFLIFAIYFRLKDILFIHSTPGIRLQLVDKPILGVNTLNFSYYFDIFRLNYLIFILVIFLIVAHPFLHNIKKKQLKNLLFIIVAIITYFISLSFFMERINLRFITPIFPLFLIISSFGIIFISENISNILKNQKLHFKKIFILLIIIIVSLNLIFGNQLSSFDYKTIHGLREETKPLLSCYSLFVYGKMYAFQSVMTHQTKINYRPAADYVKKHIIKDAIIITTDNFFNTRAYVRSNYSTNKYISDNLGYVVDGKRYDIYTGTEIIMTLDQMEKIMSLNKSIWVMANFALERHADNDVLEYIKNNFEQVYCTENYYDGLISQDVRRNNVIVYYRGGNERKEHNYTLQDLVENSVFETDSHLNSVPDNKSFSPI